MKERKRLFYVEKTPDHKLRLVQVNLEKSHLKLDKQFFTLDQAIQVFNFVAPDCQTVYVLLKSTTGYHLRALDMATGKHRELKISPQQETQPCSHFAADFCTVYAEGELVGISCYESFDTHCVSTIKIFDSQTLKLLTQESIRVDHQQGSLR